MHDVIASSAFSDCRYLDLLARNDVELCNFYAIYLTGKFLTDKQKKKRKGKYSVITTY